ncbi:hypothetical protein [Candidatus Uabimicrobium sp. HlEnr_7]|uniref:hypothetical protein n=1 Tax=Candidatus Uabimicrobium helgolandensis TaxID=3095367 RepID=UPI00355857A8
MKNKSPNKRHFVLKNVQSFLKHNPIFYIKEYKKLDLVFEELMLRKDGNSWQFSLVFENYRTNIHHFEVIENIEFGDVGELPKYLQNYIHNSEFRCEVYFVSGKSRWSLGKRLASSWLYKGFIIATKMRFKSQQNFDFKKPPIEASDNISFCLPPSRDNILHYYSLPTTKELHQYINIVEGYRLTLICLSSGEDIFAEIKKTTQGIHINLYEKMYTVQKKDEWVVRRDEFVGDIYWDKLQGLIRTTLFWELRSHEKELNCDGSHVWIEGIKNNRYHFLEGNSPERCFGVLFCSMLNLAKTSKNDIADFSY